MVPGSTRAAARIASALAAIALLTAGPAQALRVATWNLMQYPQTNLAARQPAIRTILQSLDPDILITQEMDSADGRDSLLTDVLNVVEPGQWTGSWQFLGGEGGGIFWKPAKVNIVNITSIATGGPRSVLVSLVKPLGYAGNKGWFRLYSMHLKAGNPTFTPADSTTRRVECTSLRTTLNNTTVVGPNFLIGGDTNFYGAWEGGYIRLTEPQTNNNGQCIDPLTMPGTWNSNPLYAGVDTQCPCLNGCGPSQSGGGLDDRFDLLFSSSSLRDGGGLELLTPTYTAFGNDGNHFNTDINDFGFNSAVGLEVANALQIASDHIPVVVTLQLPAKVAAPSQLAFADVIVGASAVQPLTVTNAAAAPADSLRFSLAAPAGFGAPAGTFALAAGAASAPLPVSLSTTSAGAQTGTLTVSSNDVDTTNKSVLLSGRVLAHASASLDSASVRTTSTVDFGAQPAGPIADQAVRVHDFGWNALTARLAITGGSIAGGSGRFSFAGGFVPALVAGVGATYALHFDSQGATLDSLYTATLTFSTSDEPLPGALPASDLTVMLSARVVSASSGVGDAQPVLRFLPPRPNPLHATTELAFELPAPAPVDLGIFDLGGRRIATLAAGVLGQGQHRVRWNTQTDAGQPVPAGLYFARFSTPGLTRVTRLAVLP